MCSEIRDKVEAFPGIALFTVKKSWLVEAAEASKTVSNG